MDLFQQNSAKYSCPILSEKQKTFVSISQIFIWLVLIVVVATSGVLIWYITGNINKIQNTINTFNNYSAIANYLKNPSIALSDECLSFDGKTISIKAPIVLSDNAKTNIQFENGLHVNGMSIIPNNPITFTKPILFENNMYVLRQFIVEPYTAPSFETAISASSNNLFFGNPGRTEISLVTTSSCTKDTTPAGTGSHPFPGFYVRSSGSSIYLCLCMANWVYRTPAQTFDHYNYAFPGTLAEDTYNKRDEYCVLLPTTIP